MMHTFHIFPRTTTKKKKRKEKSVSHLYKELIALQTTQGHLYDKIQYIKALNTCRTFTSWGLV